MVEDMLAERRAFMRKHAWMLVIWLTVCLPAAEPARSQASSPIAMAAARELIETMHAVDYFKSIVPAMMQAFKPAIVQKSAAGRTRLRCNRAASARRLQRAYERAHRADCGALRPQFHRRRAPRGCRVLSSPDRSKIRAEAAGDHAGGPGSRPTIRAIDRQRDPRPHDRRATKAWTQYMSLAPASGTDGIRVSRTLPFN